MLVTPVPPNMTVGMASTVVMSEEEEMGVRRDETEESDRDAELAMSTWVTAEYWGTRFTSFSVVSSEVSGISIVVVLKFG